jgi:hypothetical protein
LIRQPRRSIRAPAERLGLYDAADIVGDKKGPMLIAPTGLPWISLSALRKPDRNSCGAWGGPWGMG